MVSLSKETFNTPPSWDLYSLIEEFTNHPDYVHNTAIIFKEHSYTKTVKRLTNPSKKLSARKKNELSLKFEKTLNSENIHYQDEERNNYEQTLQCDQMDNYDDFNAYISSSTESKATIVHPATLGSPFVDNLGVDYSFNKDILNKMLEENLNNLTTRKTDNVPQDPKL